MRVLSEFSSRSEFGALKNSIKNSQVILNGAMFVE